VNIEVCCSDHDEHKKRVENRSREIRGLNLPTWKDVKDREYHDWTSDRIVIDTAGKSPAQSSQALLSRLKTEIKN
jgi:hypothetical protein